MASDTGALQQKPLNLSLGRHPSPALDRIQPKLKKFHFFGNVRLQNPYKGMNPIKSTIPPNDESCRRRPHN